MARLNIRTRNGEENQIEGVEGFSMMQIICNNGFDELLALCGGCCACATCHIYVDAADFGRLPAMGDFENELLDTSSHRTATSRLSCQVQFGEELAGIRVTIAPED